MLVNILLKIQIFLPCSIYGSSYHTNKFEMTEISDLLVHSPVNDTTIPIDNKRLQIQRSDTTTFSVLPK